MSDEEGVEKQDRGLIQRMASKDANALDAFYTRYNRIAFSLILRIVGNVNVQASARIFWDQSKRKWFFYVRDLPRLPADKSYQLWFVPNSGNPVSAAVFNTENDGSAEAEIDVPQGLATLKAAAVTTGPAGGLPQPSGAFALL